MVGLTGCGNDSEYDSSDYYNHKLDPKTPGGGASTGFRYNDYHRATEEMINQMKESLKKRMESQLSQPPLHIQKIKDILSKSTADQDKLEIVHIQYVDDVAQQCEQYGIHSEECSYAKQAKNSLISLLSDEDLRGLPVVLEHGREYVNADIASRKRQNFSNEANESMTHFLSNPIVGDNDVRSMLNFYRGGVRVLKACKEYNCNTEGVAEEHVIQLIADDFEENPDKFKSKKVVVIFSDEHDFSEACKRQGYALEVGRLNRKYYEYYEPSRDLINLVTNNQDIQEIIENIKFGVDIRALDGIAQGDGQNFVDFINDKQSHAVVKLMKKGIIPQSNDELSRLKKISSHLNNSNIENILSKRKINFLQLRYIIKNLPSELEDLKSAAEDSLLIMQRLKKAFTKFINHVKENITHDDESSPVLDQAHRIFGLEQLDRGDLMVCDKIDNINRRISVFIHPDKCASDSKCIKATEILLNAKNILENYYGCRN